MVTCSCRLENPTRFRRFASPSPLLSLHPSLFFFSGFLVSQMGGEGQTTLYIRVGGRPPSCRVARGAGRPAAGRPAPGTCLQIFSSFFAFKSLPPGGRGLAARHMGGRGLSVKKDDKKLHTSPWGPAARQRGGRPPTPI